jgi:hypothetical protein
MRKVPPTLLVALALYAACLFVHALVEILGAPEHSISFHLASEGLFLAAHVLGTAGFLELAGRTRGRTAAGLRIAAVGFLVALAIVVFWYLVNFFQPQWSRTLEVASTWSWFALILLQVLGVAIATVDRHPRAAVIGLVVMLITDPLPPIAKMMYGWIGDSWKAVTVLENGLRLVVVIVLFVLVRLVADGEPARAPNAASTGLRTIASALWLRVIAAVGVAGLTLLAMPTSPGEGAVGILKLATLSSAVINAISVALMARGALAASRAGNADLPRTPYVLAAGGAVWCAGVGVYQLPYVYRMLYGAHNNGYFLGMFNTADPTTTGYATALALLVSLVATGAMGVIATGISAFAGRRGLEGLRTEAVNKGIGFVALSLTSIAAQQWLLPRANTLGMAAFTTIAAAGCALAGTVMMARLCTFAADSLTDEPGLPMAKIV